MLSKVRYAEKSNVLNKPFMQQHRWHACATRMSLSYSAWVAWEGSGEVLEVLGM